MMLYSGTTWLQQIVWLIVNGERAENDGLNMEQRFPYIEYEYPGLKEIAKLRSPRLMKSHLPYNCLPVDVEDGCGKVTNFKARKHIHVHNVSKMSTFLFFE